MQGCHMGPPGQLHEVVECLQHMGRPLVAMERPHWSASCASRVARTCRRGGRACWQCASGRAGVWRPTASGSGAQAVAWNCVYHVLLAHAAAVKRFRALVPGGQISMNINCDWAEPRTSSAADQARPAAAPREAPLPAHAARQGRSAASQPVPHQHGGGARWHRALAPCSPVLRAACVQLRCSDPGPESCRRSACSHG